MELKTAYWWVVSKQQRKRLIDTCHFTISGLGLKWTCHKQEFYLYY